MKKKTSLSLEETTLQKLDRFAKQERRSRSQLAEMALDALTTTQIRQLVKRGTAKLRTAA